MTEQSAPQTITIELNKDEVPNMLIALYLGARITDLGKDKEACKLISGTLIDLNEKIWKQFADQFISIEQPDLYRTICNPEGPWK